MCQGTLKFKMIIHVDSFSFRMIDHIQKLQVLLCRSLDETLRGLNAYGEIMYRQVDILSLYCRPRGPLRLPLYSSIIESSCFSVTLPCSVRVGPGEWS